MALSLAFWAVFIYEVFIKEKDPSPQYPFGDSVHEKKKGCECLRCDGPRPVVAEPRRFVQVVRPASRRNRKAIDWSSDSPPSGSPIQLDVGDDEGTITSFGLDDGSLL